MHVHVHPRQHSCIRPFFNGYMWRCVCVCVFVRAAKRVANESPRACRVEASVWQPLAERVVPKISRHRCMYVRAVYALLAVLVFASVRVCVQTCFVVFA
jgi:hypothetical protein